MAKILIEHEVDLKEVIIFVFTGGQNNINTTIMKTAEQIKSEIDNLRLMNRYKNLTYTLEELWAALESLIKGENPKWIMRIRGYEDKKRTMMHPISPFSRLVAGFYLEPNYAAEIEINKADHTEEITPISEDQTFLSLNKVERDI